MSEERMERVDTPFDCRHNIVFKCWHGATWDMDEGRFKTEGFVLRGCASEKTFPNYCPLELAPPKLTPRPNGDYYECLECEKIGRIHDLKKQIDQLEHDNIRFREELE